tara:strand:- start:430 stop:702 length:273 start_codon:yes stop_codon:yes gene_type:complete
LKHKIELRDFRDQSGEVMNRLWAEADEKKDKLLVRMVLLSIDMHAYHRAFFGLVKKEKYGAQECGLLPDSDRLGNVFVTADDGDSPPCGK